MIQKIILGNILSIYNYAVQVIITCTVLFQDRKINLAVCIDKPNLWDTLYMRYQLYQNNSLTDSLIHKHSCIRKNLECNWCIRMGYCKSNSLVSIKNTSLKFVASGLSYIKCNQSFYIKHRIMDTQYRCYLDSCSSLVIHKKYKQLCYCMRYIQLGSLCILMKLCRKIVQTYSKILIMVLYSQDIRYIVEELHRYMFNNQYHRFSINFMQYLQIFQRGRLNILLRLPKLHCCSSKSYISFYLLQST